MRKYAIFVFTIVASLGMIVSSLGYIVASTNVPLDAKSTINNNNEIRQSKATDLDHIVSCLELMEISRCEDEWKKACEPNWRGCTKGDLAGKSCGGKSRQSGMATSAMHAAFSRGIKAYQQRQFDQAEIEFYTAQGDTPNALVSFWLAMALVHKGEYKRALVAIQEARDALPFLVTERKKQLNQLHLLIHGKNISLEDPTGHDLEAIADLRDRKKNSWRIIKACVPDCKEPNTYVLVSGKNPDDYCINLVNEMTGDILDLEPTNNEAL